MVKATHLEDEDNGNGNGRRASLLEINGWASAIAKVGIPGAIAIYLVYVLAGQIPAQLDAHAKESREQATRTQRILIQICVNTAPTSDDKRNCWYIADGGLVTR